MAVREAAVQMYVARRMAGVEARDVRGRVGAGQRHRQGGGCRGWRQACFNVFRFGYASAPYIKAGTPPLTPLHFGHHPADASAHFRAHPDPRTSLFALPRLLFALMCHIHLHNCLFPAQPCQAASSVTYVPQPPFPLSCSAWPTFGALVSLKLTVRDNEVTHSAFLTVTP